MIASLVAIKYKMRVHVTMLTNVDDDDDDDCLSIFRGSLRQYSRTRTTTSDRIAGTTTTRRVPQKYH
jgi:hypothetical protein